MSQDIALTHEFVEFVPDNILDGKVDVSIPFSTAVHMCCYGGGREVITSLNPTDWRLIFDG